MSAKIFSLYEFTTFLKTYQAKSLSMISTILLKTPKIPVRTPQIAINIISAETLKLLIGGRERIIKWKTLKMKYRIVMKNIDFRDIDLVNLEIVSSSRVIYLIILTHRTF